MKPQGNIILRKIMNQQQWPPMRVSYTKFHIKNPEESAMLFFFIHFVIVSMSIFVAAMTL